MPGAGAHSRLWDDAEDSADLQSAGPGQMSREPEHDPGGEDRHQVRDLTPGHQGLSLQNCMTCSFCCFFPFDLMFDECFDSCCGCVVVVVPYNRCMTINMSTYCTHCTDVYIYLAVC